MKNIKKYIIDFIYSLFRLLPIQKNKILLFSYYGEQYSGSPKYIAEYLKKNTNLDVIWAFVQPEKYRSVGSKVIRYGHLEYYLALATAGTIITNYRMTEEFHKRTGQKYIQTWHSSLRLKRIENDAVETLPERYVHMAKKDSRQLDILLAGSQKSKEIFERAFWYNGKIVETGTPQCDILFKENNVIVERVKKYYSLPEKSHIVIYAPTFRKNHDVSVYDLDTRKLLKALTMRFGGEWYLLMRLHPHLVNLTDTFYYTDHVLQATDYDDVQELLCAADFMISDYSAIIFDYSLTRKPCVLYTPDFKDYIKHDRKLYFDIEELPFQNFENQEEMLNAIQKFDSDLYKRKISDFLENIGSYDDGKACERVYQLIKNGE